MGATLILVDFQKAIDDQMYQKRGQLEAENKAADLLNHWRDSGHPIIHLRHDSMDPNSPYAPDKLGNQFKKELAPLPHEVVIEKRTQNGFIGTDLMQALEEFGSSELVICGVLLENSVESTVRMAANLGFMVFLVSDACASMEHLDILGKKYSADDVHALSLGILDGEYAKVLTSADLINSPNNETLQ